MDQQVQEKELEVQTKITALNQTELDLANAVVVIQEKDKELANIGVVAWQEDQKIQELEIKLAQKESALANLQSSFGELFYDHDNKHQELEKIKSVDPVTLTDHAGNPVAVYYPIVEAARGEVLNIPKEEVIIPDLSIGAESTNSINAGFGTNFPTNPQKGDMFLRVDYLPNKLYKWNEKKWIEVDKTKTDSFVYDQAYIKYLVEKVNSGEYDTDLLTATEQEQILRYTNEQSNKQ